MFFHTTSKTNLTRVGKSLKVICDKRQLAVKRKSVSSLLCYTNKRSGLYF